VRRILEDDQTEVNPSSDDFWILAGALKAFVVRRGRLNGFVAMDGGLGCWWADVLGFGQSM